MKKLPIEIKGKGEVYGILFTQLKRDGDICLYERSDGFYEVITVRHQKERTAFFEGQEVKFEAKEIYPSGELWDGSCLSNREHAERVYKRKLRERDGLQKSNL